MDANEVKWSDFLKIPTRMEWLKVVMMLFKKQQHKVDKLKYYILDKICLKWIWNEANNTHLPYPYVKYMSLSYELWAHFTKATMLFLIP